MLIPSLCKCSAKDLCRLLGILNLNCPEYSCRLFGSGISIPSSNAASIHAFLASAAFAMALSSVSPQVMHPGKSGKDTTNYTFLIGSCFGMVIDIHASTFDCISLTLFANSESILANK